MSRMKALIGIILILFSIIQARILRVPDDPRYQTIQRAINDAQPGDTVSVWGPPPGQPPEPPWYYDENIDYLGKPIYVANRSYIEEIPGYPPNPEYVII